jgi:hypothetical protein
MKSLIKNGLFVISLGLIVWFGYTVFFKGGDAPTLDQNAQNDARVSQEEFLAKLKDLQSLHLKPEFFKDKNFTSLVDYTVQVVDEDAGRKNPFAPVPGLIPNPPAPKK